MGSEYLRCHLDLKVQMSSKWLCVCQERRRKLCTQSMRTQNKKARVLGQNSEEDWHLKCGSKRRSLPWRLRVIEELGRKS